MFSQLAVEEIEDDPFLAASKRTTVSGSGVDVLVFDALNPEKAQAIGEGLVQLLRKRNRYAEARVLDSSTSTGMAVVLEAAIASTTQDLLLVTTAVDFWRPEHLDPLLAAIESADHVIGRRPVGFPLGLKRWLGWGIRSTVYAVPIHDIHSPCTLHRRDSLQSIPLQSESAFADLELLAKATFLSRLLIEVPVPDLQADEDSRRWALWRHDRSDLWRKTIFRRPTPTPSTPAEVPQGEQEGDASPGDQNEQ